MTIFDLPKTEVELDELRKMDRKRKPVKFKKEQKDEAPDNKT